MKEDGGVGGGSRRIKSLNQSRKPRLSMSGLGIRSHSRSCLLDRGSIRLWTLFMLLPTLMGPQRMRNCTKQ